MCWKQAIYFWKHGATKKIRFDDSTSQCFASDRNEPSFIYEPCREHSSTIQRGRSVATMISGVLSLQDASPRAEEHQLNGEHCCELYKTGLPVDESV